MDISKLETPSIVLEKINRQFHQSRRRPEPVEAYVLEMVTELAEAYSASSLRQIKDHALSANAILRDHKAPLHERRKFQALAIAIDDMLDLIDAERPIGKA